MTILIGALAAAQISSAQSMLEARGSSTSVIKSASTLVTVPTVVSDPSGDLVSDLKVDRFRISDNGIRQKLSLEDTKNQPIALVVLMQTGGSAPAQFQNYKDLPRILDVFLGSTTNEITLVTFDGRPEATWHFPIRSDGVAYALSHPVAGGDGAAILDAVDYGVDLLQRESGHFQRIVLLLSQAEDDGSVIPAEKLVRRLGESSTAVYSLTYSNAKAKPQFRSKQKATPHIPAKPSRHSSQGDLSTPLTVALKALREDTAAEVAGQTGGENLKFQGARDFDTQLSAIADHIQSRYLLTFQPSSHEPGFHTLAISTAEKKSHFNVSGRSSYWFSSDSQ